MLLTTKCSQKEFNTFKNPRLAFPTLDPPISLCRFIDLMGPVPDSNGSAAPPPATPAMTTDNMLDLLDGPILGGPATATTAAPTASAAPGVVDPFAASDVDPLGAMAGGADQGALPPSVQVLGDIEQWFRALAVKDKGILYEDTNLQVNKGAVGLLGFEGSNMHLDVCSLFYVVVQKLGLDLIAYSIVFWCIALLCIVNTRLATNCGTMALRSI